MKRILSPSTKFYTVGDHNAVNAATQAQIAAAESPDDRRQSGKGDGDAAAGSAGIAAAYSPAGTAGKANVSTGAPVSDYNKQVPCPNKTGFRLDFTEESLLNGIIMAEVLGKPKYFRKGRWS